MDKGRDAQSAVLAFLADPATHALPPGEGVERIDTHGAVVFLAGSRAYKVKRAVRYAFLDFSTLDKRRAMCRREVDINRATAPDIYLGTATVTREADGRLAIDGDGEIVEWAVVMRRFDAAATLDRRLGDGPLPDTLVDALAAAVAAMHAAVPVRSVADPPERMRAVAVDNADALRARPGLFDGGEAGRAIAGCEDALHRHAALIRARAAAGHVRRCHGDLHSGNVALVDGRPVIFDALEFDEDLATVDVLYDFAFLVMDLWVRGDGSAANRLLNRWLALRRIEDDIEGLALLPVFLAMRAMVRAKVAALRGAASPDDREAADAEARSRLAAGLEFLERGVPRIVAVGGLSGSGKTTLAARLAPFVVGPPGAVHLRSDVERKALAGVGETQRLAPERYTAQASAAVYEALYAKARRCLDAGMPVVVDAVFARVEERAAIERVARDAGVAFGGIWLEAPRQTLIGRVSKRTGDASDADARVVEAQSAYETGPVGWARIDAGGGPARTVAAAREVLGGALSRRAP